MKKDILATEDFEPPSPVSGLGEYKVKTGSDSSPEVKENPKIISIQKVPHFPRFRCSPRTTAFRKRFYPAGNPADWNDWRWQLRARIRDIEALTRILTPPRMNDWP